MLVLVWILTWLPLVLPAVSELPKPINVTPTSTAFGYILSWDPGLGTPSGTSYSVSTQTDRSSQIPVTGCQLVQYPWTCNLTETFKDPWEKYDIRVTAELGAQRSLPAEVQYKPIDHLDLLKLTVVPCQRNLCVDFQPSQHHPPWIYDGLGYELQISSAGAGEAQIIKNFRSLETQVVTDLLPGRKYCVSVRFFDSLENKISNYSRPVCVSTPDVFSADPLILFTLFSLVVLVLVGVVLQVWTGFLCLNWRPLPPILTSIHHLEEVLVRASSSSLMNIKLVVPPAGMKRSSGSSSADSDEDYGTSCRSSSRGGGYTERVGTNLQSSSSSSSSSSLSSKQKTEISSCSRTPDGSKPQPQTLSETGPRTELNTLSSDGLTQGRTEEEEEEEQEEVGGSVGQEVNLLTLTFGRQEEEEKEEEQYSAGPLEGSSVPLVPLVLPSQPAASPWTEGDEEATDETCGYMVRPSAHVLTEPPVKHPTTEGSNRTSCQTPDD